MIDFLDELGNFKQKNFYTSKCIFFYNLQQQTPRRYIISLPDKIILPWLVVYNNICDGQLKKGFQFLDSMIPKNFKQTNSQVWSEGIILYVGNN